MQDRKSGTTLDSTKNKIETKHKMTVNVEEVRRFWGFASFYMRLIFYLSKTVGPLMGILRKSRFHWIEKHLVGIFLLEQKLIREPSTKSSYPSVYFKLRESFFQLDLKTLTKLHDFSCLLILDFKGIN